MAKSPYGLAAGALVVLAQAALSGPLAAEPRVAVTIKPVHALVSRVMEGIGTPLLLVGGSASPHTYAMKPSDAQALAGANVFFRVSEAVEPFTAKVVAALPSSVRVVTLADAPGVALLDVRTGATFEAHQHAHEGHSLAELVTSHKETAHAPDGSGPGKDAARAKSEPDAAGQVRDGHVWLDPANAKAMVREIVRALSAASPQDAPRFEKNGAALSAELDALAREIEQNLAPVQGKPFVVFHDAYQYFERRFGLAAQGSITVSPEVPPSARRLSEIRKKIADLNAACVFAEPLFQPRLVAVVTEGTGARTATLDPEGMLVEPGPGAYATLLRKLAEGVKSCLAGPQTAPQAAPK